MPELRGEAGEAGGGEVVLINVRDVGVTAVMLEDLSRMAQIYACRGERQRAGRIMGVLQEHPAWDGDWSELT